METLPALTDDEYEIDILTGEYAEEIEPDDPYYLEASRIQSEIAHISRSLPAKRRGVARLFLENKRNVEIAEILCCSPHTITTALQDERVRRQIFLLQRLNQLQNGPSIEARTAMLWRIALREETKRPNISLRALDVLNRAEGVYSEPESEDGKVIVEQVTFVLQQPDNAPKDVTPAIEGEFTPIEVDV